jgi:hypothetical protein
MRKNKKAEIWRMVGVLIKTPFEIWKANEGGRKR